MKKIIFLCLFIFIINLGFTQGYKSLFESDSLLKEKSLEILTNDLVLGKKSYKEIDVYYSYGRNDQNSNMWKTFGFDVRDENNNRSLNFETMINNSYKNSLINLGYKFTGITKLDNDEEEIYVNCDKNTIFKFMNYNMKNKHIIMMEWVSDKEINSNKLYKYCFKDCFKKGNNKEESIKDLTNNAEEANEKLLFIYNLDVLNYYELSNYDTELKKEVFKKTEEYQNKLNELKGIKAAMLKSIYYINLPYAFTNDELHKVDYDLKRKGFKIDLGSYYDGDGLKIRPSKFLFFKSYGGGILLKALPTEKTEYDVEGIGPIYFGGIPIYYEKLFLPFSEETGLEIENNRENMGVYFFFTPSGKENWVLERGSYKVTHNELKSDKVRVVVANMSTGKIYFDKTYTYKSPTQNKVKK